MKPPQSVVPLPLVLLPTGRARVGRRARSLPQMTREPVPFLMPMVPCAAPRWLAVGVQSGEPQPLEQGVLRWGVFSLPAPDRTSHPDHRHPFSEGRKRGPEKLRARRVSSPLSVCPGVHPWLDTWPKAPES